MDIGKNVDAEEVANKNKWAMAERNLEVFCADTLNDCCAKCEHWRYDQTGVTGECVKSVNMSGRDRISTLGLINYTGPLLEAGPMIVERGYCCELFEEEK